MRIGVDAMGGDETPLVQIQGALQAAEELDPEDRIVLIGDAAAIARHLAALGQPEDVVEVVHADDVVGMDEAPVEALRTKPNNSIARMAQMHADGELDACVSAGNTGACVAAAQMRLRRLAGVHRPGIAVVTPTYHGPVVLCDVGSNVNCRPQHLHQYGVMASVYSREICGVEKPRVGLLSVGQEDAKGNQLVRQTRELIQNDPRLCFVGNVEGRDLFLDVCDVVVCDGFVGNVALKLMEGMGSSVVKSMRSELQRTMRDHEAEVQRAAQTVAAKYDFNEHGGAPLLGVGGIFIICHGASNARGIRNAVHVAVGFGRHRVNEQITERLSEAQRAAHE